MAVGWSEGLEELKPRLIATFGEGIETLRTASRVLELMAKAWHDSYGEGSVPSEEIVDDVLVCSGGTLPGLIDAAHLAVVDWRDLVVWASKVRATSD